MTDYQGPSQWNAGEIDDKLRQEEEKLKTLQENVSRSRQLKEGMLCILDSFENRLGHLEASVLPLYEHTAMLQRKQHNMAKTVKAVDAILGFYNTAREMDSVIRESNPSNNLDGYLRQMEKLKEAASFFSTDHSHEHQLDNMNATFELGCSALEKEYRNILNRNSVPAKPTILLECLDANFEVIPTRLDTIQTMTDVETLRKIGQWLLNYHSNVDFLNAYAEIRGTNMLATLQSLKAMRRGSSASKSLISHSESPRGDRKTTMIVMDVIRKASRVYGSDRGYRRTSIQTIDSTGDNSTERDSETFILMFNCFVALLKIETELSKQTIGNSKYEAKLERLLISKSLSFALEFGRSVVNSVRLAIQRQECTVVLCLLPVANQLHCKYDQFNQLAMNAGDELYEKFSSLFRNVDALCVKGLEEFVDTLKNDQDKFVPKDGTVHQVTSNTVTFLKQLMDQRPAMASVLPDGPGDLATVAVPKLFARILSALGLNLRNKAESYQDVTLKTIFMLNNQNHILNTLHESGILKVVCEHNREVDNFYKSQVTDLVEQYLNCWTKVMASIEEYDMNRCTASLLNDRDKEIVKSTFALFNQEMDTLSQVQKDIIIADLQLSNIIKRKIKERVISKYTAFYTNFYVVRFSKNPNKYLRYSPDDVALFIDRLF